MFEHEPEVAQALKDEPSIVLTPHTAGLSPEALDATVELVIQNLEAFRDGRPPVTPAPFDLPPFEVTDLTGERHEG